MHVIPKIKLQEFTNTLNKILKIKIPKLDINGEYLNKTECKKEKILEMF